MNKMFSIVINLTLLNKLKRDSIEIWIKKKKKNDSSS